MIFVNHNNTNPYFNHSAEEYILKNINEDCFMLWRNEPCILIGRNQNSLSEVNVDYVKENNIKVVRRITGGGAVFNDLGNINFSFICKSSDDLSANFLKFTAPLIKALNSLGVDASFSGRNDMVIGDRKFSGNAQFYYNDKVLHHGTLLFSSCMTDLSSALNVNPLKIKAKGIKSVSSHVTNISEHLHRPMSVEEFKNYIIDFVMNLYNEEKLYNFTENDLKEINKICENKFSTWKWNFGNSPRYSYKKEKRFDYGTIEVNFQVTNGYIKKIKFYGDFFFTKNIEGFEQYFIGIEHDENSIKHVLLNINIEDYIKGISINDILSLMF